MPGGTGSSAIRAAAAAPAGFAYFAGSAANFALQPALQKYTGLPSCSSTCGDSAVTVIPQTGSLNASDVSVAGAASAFMEQQGAPPAAAWAEC